MSGWLPSPSRTGAARLFTDPRLKGREVLPPKRIKTVEDCSWDAGGLLNAVLQIAIEEPLPYYELFVINCRFRRFCPFSSH